MACGQNAASGGTIDWFERVAVGASVLCLLHCIAFPLFLAVLPALTTILPISESFHVWMLCVAIPTSGATLALGYRDHRVRWFLAIGCVGLCFLGAGALIFLGTSLDTPVTIAGSLLIAAHILNWRRRHAAHHRH
jgi:uncharacterized membrane protein YfcA